VKPALILDERAIRVQLLRTAMHGLAPPPSAPSLPPLAPTNPKYNRTCSLAVTGVPGRGKLLNLSKCVGRNAGDHLDFGVAPYLYDGLFPRAAGRTNVMQKLYPLRAPITLGSGALEASNKIFSKHSLVRYRPASALASSTSRLEVCVFDRDGMMVQNSTVVGYASVRLGEGQMVIVSDVAGG
jgi:hypothetical protein